MKNTTMTTIHLVTIAPIKNILINPNHNPAKSNNYNQEIINILKMTFSRDKNGNKFKCNLTPNRMDNNNLGNSISNNHITNGKPTIHNNSISLNLNTHHIHQR